MDFPLRTSNDILFQKICMRKTIQAFQASRFHMCEYVRIFNQHFIHKTTNSWTWTEHEKRLLEYWIFVNFVQMAKMDSIE